MLKVILLLLIYLFSSNAKYSLSDLDEDFQERISKATQDNDNHENTFEKLTEIKNILKEIINRKQTSLSESVEENLEISLEGNVLNDKPKSCNQYFGCGECVTNNCGWCISERACKPDAAWQCQGDHDHVGLSGIGRFRECPSVAEIDEQRAERRRKKAEAELMKSDSDLIRSNNESNHTINGDDNQSGSIQMSKEDKTKELERRVKLALEGYGKTNPYETLGVESTASNGEIRKAYRKLSLLYHPDKNVGPDRENADIVFKDIVIAFDILGDPEKREYFDSIGSESRESFNTYDDYIRFGQKNEQNFYQGNKLITALSEATWDRRVGVGENVWLVEFYAPWCSHCQQKTSEFRNIAEILADEQVEIGAVNCAAQGVMCNARFGIRQYPTLLAFSNILSRDESGKSGQRGTWALRQEYDGVFESAAIVAWLRAVAREWRWLARTSSLARITNRADFVTSVLSSTDFWIIIFLDGLDCASCAAAHTNALRLSASLRDFAGVRIGLVDCEDPDAYDLCYQDEGLPARPHAPVMKGYAAGDKSDGRVRGEVLYNTNEVESHVALEITERVLRLALADQRTDAVSEEQSAYEKTTEDYQEDEREKQSRQPVEPMWNGPKRRDPVAWGGGGGGGFPNRERLG